MNSYPMGGLESFSGSEHVDSDAERLFDVEEKKGFSDIITGVENEIVQSRAIRNVEKLGDGRCKIPYDRKGVKYNFYVTRTYKPDGILFETKKILNGEEMIDVTCNKEQEDINDIDEFFIVLGDILDEVVGENRQKIPEKAKDVYSILFETSTEFDNEPGVVEQLGLNKVKFPYYTQDKKCDFVFTRLPHEIQVQRTIREISPKDNSMFTQEVSIRSVDFEAFNATKMGELLNDVFGEKRKRIPEEARQVLDVLENPSIDKAFDEATFKQYESSKYTYGVTLDYYNEYLKDKLSTHLEGIPIDQRFSVVLNAVLDYNKGLCSAWHPETTDDFFLPNKLDFYISYIQQVALVAYENNEIVVGGSEILTINDGFDYLLAHGRNGFMNVGNRSKTKEKDYVYMKNMTGKHARFNKKVEGTNMNLYSYIRKEIQDSDLSVTMKKIVLALPMQESSFKNEYVKGRSRKEAHYFRQFIASTARTYGLKVNARVDERKDIKKSTTAALKYFKALHDTMSEDENLQNILKKYNITDRQTKDMIISFMAVNGYNSGEGHMQRACHIMNSNARAKKDVSKFVKQYGDLGIILYLTNEYPKHAAKYQKGITPKYLIHSPEYMYNIFKFVQLDSA